MRRNAITLAFFTTSLVFAQTIAVEDFESGKFSWQSRHEMSKVTTEYKVVQEEGNHFLRGAPEPGAEGKIVYKKFHVDLKKTPFLKWRWRVQKLPKDGDEGAGKNDSAAGVYVYLQKGMLRRLLKYCWSTNHVGKEWMVSGSSNWLWKTRMKVLRHGPPLGEWMEETVDIKKDFKEAYGEEAPDSAEGIGVLTDGDQTHSESVGDYDDFVLLSVPKQ